MDEAPRLGAVHYQSDGSILADRRVLVSERVASDGTIRRHGVPIACDVRTRAVLYDLTQILDATAKVHRRRSRAAA